MIGWVYETPHEKVKEAERDLEDFYNDDLVNDLEATADKEKEILDKRIEQWELYLQALEWRYNEQERILRDQLLMELLNVESQEEIAERIFEDWDNFNEYCEGSFKNYDGIFNDFLDSYRDNVLELDALQKEQKEVLSSSLSGIMGSNDQNLEMGLGNMDNIENAMGMSEEDKKALAAAGKKYNIAQQAYLSTTDAVLKEAMKQAMEQAHEEAEAIRAKYGYSGGADGSALIIIDKGLYAQYMGDGYKNQMDTEEEFYDFYDNLFDDFGNIEDDRLNDVSDFANALKNNYGKVDSSNNGYLKDENTFLDGHESNGFWQANINDDIIQNWLMYENDFSITSDYITMDFAEFLEKYRDQIYEYAELQGELEDLFENQPESGSGGTAGGGDAPGMEGDYEHWDEMTKEDQEALKAAGEKYNKYAELYAQTGLQKYKELMEEAHEEAEAIRKKYGYSGGDDGSDNIPQGMEGDYEHKNEMSAADKKALAEAGERYNKAAKLYEETGDAYYKELMEKAHEDAEAIRKKYGYSGGTDGSGNLEVASEYYDALADIESDRVNDYESYVGSVASISDDLSAVNNASATDFSKYASKIATLYNQKYAQDTLSNRNEESNVNYHGDNAIAQANINEDIINDWLNFTKNTQVEYDLINMNMSDFLEKYADNIEEFAKLRDKYGDLMDSDYEVSVDKEGNIQVSGGNSSEDKWSGNSNDSIGSSGSSKDDWLGGQSFSEWLEDHDAPSDVIIGEIMRESGMDYDEARDYYNDHVKKSSGSSSKSGSSKSNSSKRTSSSSKKTNSNSSSKKTSSSNNLMARDISNAGKTVEKNGYLITYDENGYAKSAKKKGYADGIKQGPVTYTGLAMLHGSPGKPEYVLNNDQAYNLLYNLATTKKPEIEDGEAKGDNYIYNISEVNIDGTEDPADFWNSVMNAAGNRHNVTKNGTNKNR